ncbi:hypothetical protein J3R83DRAFT_9628 [Lanmaoa asiatica]|nr:hypothetical protein J3R83DRAFT_9628 [Lanmaoa asiatica]
MSRINIMHGHTCNQQRSLSWYSPVIMMKFSTANGGLVLAYLISSVLAGATYSLSDSIVGEGFYNAFNFEAIPDPTSGRV